MKVIKKFLLMALLAGGALQPFAAQAAFWDNWSWKGVQKSVSSAASSTVNWFKNMTVSKALLLAGAGVVAWGGYSVLNDVAVIEEEKEEKKPICNDVAVIEEEEEKVLLDACCKGDLEQVERSLEKLMRPQIKNFEFEFYHADKALLKALSNKKTEVARFLLKNKPDYMLFSRTSKNAPIFWQCFEIALKDNEHTDIAKAIFDKTLIGLNTLLKPHDFLYKVKECGLDEAIKKLKNPSEDFLKNISEEDFYVFSFWLLPGALSLWELGLDPVILDTANDEDKEFYKEQLKKFLRLACILDRPGLVKLHKSNINKMGWEIKDFDQKGECGSLIQAATRYKSCKAREAFMEVWPDKYLISSLRGKIENKKFSDTLFKF